MKRMAESIKSTLSTRDVMEYYGIEFNRHGFAICPFHSEKTASLSVKKNYFKCFGCGASGDVIDFVMMYFGIDFGQAIVRLGSDFGLRVANRRPTIADMARIKEEKRIADAEKQVKERYRLLYLAVTMAYQRLYRLNSPNLHKTMGKMEEWLNENIEMGK